MTNAEKYRDEIIKIIWKETNIFAVKDGVPCDCCLTSCEDCELLIQKDIWTGIQSPLHCQRAAIDWLLKEYKGDDK